MERHIIQLRELAARGVVMTVSVRGLATLEVPVTLAELGIPVGDPRGIRLRPGRRLLIPQDLYHRLRAAEERARAALYENSLRLVSAMLGGGYYIPEAALEKVQGELDRARADFEAAREELLARLPEIREEAEQMALAIARRAWKASRKIREAFQGNAEQFSQWLLQGILERLEERRIRDLRMEVRVAGLLLLSDLAEERARLEAARAREEAEREIQRLRVLEESDRQRAVRQAIIEEARRQLAEDIEPFRAVLAELQARIYQESRRILDEIQARGYLHPQLRARILRMARDLRVLNVLEDPDLDRLLRRIREAAERCPAAVRGKPAPRADGVDPDQALGALRAVLEAALEATREGVTYLGVAMEVE